MLVLKNLHLGSQLLVLCLGSSVSNLECVVEIFKLVESEGKRETFG